MLYRISNEHGQYNNALDITAKDCNMRSLVTTVPAFNVCEPCVLFSEHPGSLRSVLVSHASPAPAGAVCCLCGGEGEE